jgi:hypothetical protein
MPVDETSLDASLDTIIEIPTIASVVATSQRRDGRDRVITNDSAPVISGALPSATTVPIATPVERTAAKKVAP